MYKINTFSGLNEHKSIIFDLKFIYGNIEDKIKEAKNKKILLLFTVYRGKNAEGLILKMMKQEWLFVLVFLIQIYQI